MRKRVKKWHHTTPPGKCNVEACHSQTSLSFTDPKDPFELSLMLHKRLRFYNVDKSNDLERIQIRIGISSGNNAGNSSDAGST